MKKSFLLRGIFAILIVFIVGLSAVSCVDSNNGDGNDGALADKTALNAEIALEITEQGDYTVDSYNAYLAKLAEAKSAAELNFNSSPFAAKTPSIHAQHIRAPVFLL